jgi:peroxiredoxin Q/BCP
MDRGHVVLSEAQMIQTGQQFPNFSLANQDNKTRTLQDYAGKWLVLYVYPKDDTPGCTIQGNSFTKEKAQFEKLGVNIVGISADDVKSHKDFCTKFSFTIELLADPKAELLKAAGVGQKEFSGTMYWMRTTFLIDPQGKVRKVYENVQANGHEAVLLKDVEEIQRFAHS